MGISRTEGPYSILECDCDFEDERKNRQVTDAEIETQSDTLAAEDQLKSIVCDQCTGNEFIRGDQRQEVVDALRTALAIIEQSGAAAPKEAKREEPAHIEIDDGVLIVRDGTLSVTICAETATINDVDSGLPAVKVPLDYNSIHEAIDRPRPDHSKGRVGGLAKAVATNQVAHPVMAKVQALTWERVSPLEKKDPQWRAAHSLGEYVIIEDFAQKDYWSPSLGANVNFKTLDKAKAAVQLHYVEGVRAAVDLHINSDELIRELGIAILGNRHRINDDEIVICHEPKSPGHNTLNQVWKRIGQVMSGWMPLHPATKEDQQP